MRTQKNSSLTFKLLEILYCLCTAVDRQDPGGPHTMFRIGEFSKVAQVPGSLLRYYDEIGLLKPAHLDPETGYRYYSARQLPRLHTILALKELGLSLDQIRHLVVAEVSEETLRGMLTLRKAQV